MVAMRFITSIGDDRRSGSFKMLAASCHTRTAAAKLIKLLVLLCTVVEIVQGERSPYACGFKLK